MGFHFKPLGRPASISEANWSRWKWQLQNISNKGLASQKPHRFWTTGATPYYQYLLDCFPALSLMARPNPKESHKGLQALQDPLGEARHSPLPGLIHRYPDRVLLLLTDTCGVYCRYCTRKRWTGGKKALLGISQREQIFQYIKQNPGIREVIVSGGDPLTLSDNVLKKTLERLRAIAHIEIIRIASRMPTACPMRLTDSLLKILKALQPVFLMTHFNHPLELTAEVAQALHRTAEAGILMFNQTVLLKGVNNHPALIQALMRRLLYLRVKPYYMFQCDPSQGTDHFRTSIPQSLLIQKELWGRFSGLALPALSVDIPGGGGKVGLNPDFIVEKTPDQWFFKGWDNIKGTYANPPDRALPDDKSFAGSADLRPYWEEWKTLKQQSSGKKDFD